MKPPKPIRKIRPAVRRGRLRGKAMTELRTQCFVRATGTVCVIHHCERCGRIIMWDTFHMHHKIPKTRGGTDTLENVEALCQKCHKEQHDGAKPVPPKSGESLSQQLQRERALGARREGTQTEVSDPKTSPAGVAIP